MKRILQFAAVCILLTLPVLLPTWLPAQTTILGSTVVTGGSGSGGAGSLATYSKIGTVAGGICYTSPYTITTDAFAAFNACLSQLPPSGGVIDALALGTANYTVTTPLTALNTSGARVALLLNAGTTFTLNQVFSSPTNSPASCGVPVGQGSAVIAAGATAPNFLVGNSFVGWDVVCNGDFSGAQSTLRLDGVNVQGNSAATVSGALIHLKGLFNGTPRVENSSTSLCNAQCWELDAAASAGEGNVLLLNDQFADGGVSGTYPGSVVGIDAVSSQGGLGNITFVGGAIKFNGPHNQLITINGRGSLQANTIAFLNTGFVTAAATASAGNPNVDPIQIVDAAQVYFSSLHLAGLTNSAAQANAVDISATVANQNYGISINDMEVFTAAGFTRMINNVAEGTSETGYANGNGDTVLPNYFYGQIMPQIRQSNYVPTGACISGSIQTNSAASPTLYVCTAGVWTAITGGGGGGGGLGTLQNDLVGNNAANTSALDLFNFYATASYASQTAVSAAASNSGVATLMPGSAGGFTNTSNTLGVKVQDLNNLGATARSVTEQGAWCDARQISVTISSGSHTVNDFGDLFFPADIGKIITLVGAVGGVPTAYETAITAVAGDGHSATVQTAAPVAFSTQTPAILGHDDTAAIAAAQAAAVTNKQNGATYFTAISFPGGNCLTHTQTYLGESMMGLNGILSQITGFPGEDVFAQPDPAVSTAQEANGAHIHDLHISTDNRIDATLPWQIINDSGTTAKTALYRPTGILSVWANNPLAPGWLQGSGNNSWGAYDGVANVTAASAVICTPNALTSPVVGNTIVFPYLSSVFTTTVASTAGSCSSGFTARTLTASLPAGSTNAQAVWFAGTSVQRLGGSYSGSGCPATMTLTNSILPVAPANPDTPANVAAYGLVQVDGEQFTYFGRTNAFTGGVSTNYLTITGCAQNGTSRAAHSTNATVVPLNPFKPTLPWPVTPTLTPWISTGSPGSTTPANAAFYPAWNVGNSGLASPNTNGNTGSVAGSFSNSQMTTVLFDTVPSSSPINHTAGIYLVGLPYSSSFQDLTIFGTYFGIEEGQPSIQTGGNWAAGQPTADGTHWAGVRISSCDIFDFISGGQNSYRDFNVYSDCADPSNPSTLNFGADAGMAFTQGWNDQTGFADAIMGNIDLHNMYMEGEFASGGEPTPHYGLVPGYEFDISHGNWDNLHLGSGQEVYIGGNNQNFKGGNFNNGGTLPIINYGGGNSSDETTLMFGGGAGGGVGNIYGTNALINYGRNSGFSSTLGNFTTAPYGPSQLGNSREPTHGQTNETWNLGNTTAPFVSSNGGYIPASEFNSSHSWESNPFQPWFYDATSPSSGTVQCPLTTDGLSACFSTNFNTGFGIQIGPGQRLVGGKYMLTVASKSTGAASSYHIQVGTCALGDTANITVPVTSSYGVYSTQVDFTTPLASCPTTGLLTLFFTTPSSNDTISLGYVDFAPVGQQPTFDNLNLLTSLQLNSVNGTPGQVPTVQSDGTLRWGPGGTGISALTGDVMASGTGSVAATVQRIGGGTLFSGFTGLLQNTAGAVTQATGFNLSGAGQVGTTLRSGTYTVPCTNTPIFDLSQGDSQFLTLSTGCTAVSSSTAVNVPAAPVTGIVRTFICQDATGGRPFPTPSWAIGWTPVTQVANGCTSEILILVNGILQADNYNSENCISAASPAVCDQAVGGEVAIPAGSSPTLQINTTAYGAHSQIIFTPDQTLGTDLGITCGTSVPTGPIQTTASNPGVSVTIQAPGTISGNFCGKYTVRNL